MSLSPQRSTSFENAIAHDIDLDQGELLPAGFGVRAIALIVDAIIFGSIQALFGALFIESGPLFSSLMGFVLSCTYFVFVAWYFQGQSLGKKLIGIRIVKNSLGPVGLKDLLMRELIGKFITTLAFGIGYLFVLFRKDRLALHDMIASTRVVILPGRSKIQKLSWVYSLGFVVILGGGFFGYTYYRTLYTSYGLEQVAKKLERVGVQMEGIEGSPIEGYKIAKITFDFPNLKGELNKIYFLPDGSSGSFQAFARKDIKIKKLLLGSGSVRFSGMEDKLQNRSLGITPLLTHYLLNPKFDPSLLLGSRAADKDSTIAALDLGYADLNNLDISFSDEVTFRISQFELVGIKWDQVHTDWESIKLNSEVMEWDIPSGKIVGSTISMGRGIKGVISQSLYQERLKSDMDFNLLVSGPVTRPDIQLSLFGESLTIRRSADRSHIAARGFNPSKHLKNIPPISNLDGSWSSSTGLLDGELRGEFLLRGRPFDLSMSGSQYFAAAKSSVSKLRLHGSFVKLFILEDSEKFQFQVQSASSDSAQDELARLYYGRPFGGLGAQAQRVINYDAQYFQQRPNSVERGLASRYQEFLSGTFSPTPLPEGRAPTRAKKEIQKLETYRRRRGR